MGTVFVSGSFDKITFGDNDSADKLSGGIADVGLNGVGVDDVVEDIYGTTASQFRYDQSVGNITLAISASTGPGEAGVANGFSVVDNVVVLAPPRRFEVKKNSYAIGMNFSASGATFGIGYDSEKTISAGIGYITGQISANALYARADKPYRHLGADLSVGEALPGQANHVDGIFDAGYSGLGIDVSYTIGASTLTRVYAKTDLSNIQPRWVGTGAAAAVVFSSASFKGLGVGLSHDLGGGASLVAGFGQVPQMAYEDLGVTEIGQLGGQFFSNRPDLSGKKYVASVGLSFSF